MNPQKFLIVGAVGLIVILATSSFLISQYSTVSEDSFETVDDTIPNVSGTIPTANVPGTTSTPFSNTQNPTRENEGIRGPSVVKVGELRSWASDPVPSGVGKISYKFCWGDGTCGYGGTEEFTYADSSQPATVLHAYAKTGDYVITVDVRDEEGSKVTRTFKVKVTPSDSGINIENSSSLNGSVGKYLYVKFIITGNKVSYQWEVSSGSLPPGLVIKGAALPGGECEESDNCPAEDNNYIMLQGTPTKAGTYTFEITVLDGQGKAGVGRFTSVIDN
ncbi:MAG: PKD domain-containing protein [Patescibacteria group bacterium]